jgi:hypothetical protein
MKAFKIVLAFIITLTLLGQTKLVKADELKQLPWSVQLTTVNKAWNDSFSDIQEAPQRAVPKGENFETSIASQNDEELAKGKADFQQYVNDRINQLAKDNMHLNWNTWFDEADKLQNYWGAKAVTSTVLPVWGWLVTSFAAGGVAAITAADANNVTQAQKAGLVAGAAVLALVPKLWDTITTGDGTEIAFASANQKTANTYLAEYIDLRLKYGTVNSIQEQINEITSPNELEKSKTEFENEFTALSKDGLNVQALFGKTKF